MTERAPVDRGLFSEEETETLNLLVKDYLKEYFSPRVLGDAKDEAWLMKSTFPVWKSIREKREPENIRILNLMEFGDVITFAQERVTLDKNRLEKLQSGTDDYRVRQESLTGWQIIAQAAEIAMDPNFHGLHEMGH